MFSKNKCFVDAEALAIILYFTFNVDFFLSFARADDLRYVRAFCLLLCSWKNLLFKSKGRSSTIPQSK